MQDIKQKLIHNFGKMVLLSYKIDSITRQDLLRIKETCTFETVFTKRDGTSLVIPLSSILDMEIKKINVLPMGLFLGKEQMAENAKKHGLIDKSITKIVQFLKSQEEYHIQTRTATFSKNGSISKTKGRPYDLELTTFRWADESVDLAICPIAMVNKQHLVGIDPVGNFHTLTKDGKAIDLLPPDLLSHESKEIQTVNKNSLKYLAKLLGILLLKITKKCRPLSRVCFLHIQIFYFISL